MAFRHGDSKAAIYKQGFYQLTKNMSQTEINSLLLTYEKMTDEERKNPNK